MSISHLRVVILAANSTWLAERALISRIRIIHLSNMTSKYLGVDRYSRRNLELDLETMHHLIKTH